MYHSAKLNGKKLSGGNVSSTRKMAVITGATSGIGKAYAGYFASQGCDLLLTGRRREMIMKVAADLKTRFSVNVEVVIADFSRNEDIAALLQAVGKQKNIEILINNAGYGIEYKFIEDEIDHQLDMLKIHVEVPLMLIHQVLPTMMNNGSGIIINVSSLAAYMPAAGNTMYTSTKSFLKNFTESLHMDVNHYGIKVQCLCPGFTHSDYHRNLSISADHMKQGLNYWMKPSEVVDYSIYCLNKGQVICIPGFLNRVVSHLVVTVPRSLYYWIALKMEKKIRNHQHSPDLAIMQAYSNKPVQGVRRPHLLPLKWLPFL